MAMKMSFRSVVWNGGIGTLSGLFWSDHFSYRNGLMSMTERALRTTWAKLIRHRLNGGEEDFLSRHHSLLSSPFSYRRFHRIYTAIPFSNNLHPTPSLRFSNLKVIDLFLSLFQLTLVLPTNIIDLFLSVTYCFIDFINVIKAVSSSQSGKFSLISIDASGVTHYVLDRIYSIHELCNSSSNINGRLMSDFNSTINENCKPYSKFHSNSRTEPHLCKIMENSKLNLTLVRIQ